MAASATSSGGALPEQLTNRTPILGLKLYILILVFLVMVLSFVIVILVCVRRSLKKRKMRVKHISSGTIPLVSKEIVEVNTLDLAHHLKMENDVVVVVDADADDVADQRKKKQGESEIKVEINERRRGRRKRENENEEEEESDHDEVSVECPNIGWGRWFSLKELQEATDGFAEGNVIGEGGYGIVYRGILHDGSVVAVKNLLNNKGQAEKEFKVEVEAIGKVRHKNLVRLVGYCAEGVQRMLVYEYIDNGTLEQWLHGDVGSVSPLTWDIRMRIAVGTAKGLAYLHEGLEPKVVHRDVKSSNILLDKNWNAKVSDFGLAKLLGSEKSYVTTRVMGTFGYVSPEYASTGMLNEGSDVYSFGILLMELITGRSPIDYSRPPAEMNLVDWFKGMVTSRRGDELVDPLIEMKPSPRSLKRALLVCLRCIDLDVGKRPKMGQIVHMLEADDFPYRSEPHTIREKGHVSSKVPYPTRLVDPVDKSSWR